MARQLFDEEQMAEGLRHLQSRKAKRPFAARNEGLVKVPTTAVRADVVWRCGERGLFSAQCPKRNR